MPGARDGYVYLYSQDAASAYDGADRLVMARVLKERIREKEAYEYFSGLSDAGEPKWSAQAADRAGALENPGRVYRTSVSFNSGLKRYMACVILPEEDTRFAGGFSVYDAPEPWGPWTTVYYVEKWDVGPGETCHFPDEMDERGWPHYSDGVFGGMTTFP